MNCQIPFIEWEKTLRPGDSYGRRNLDAFQSGFMLNVNPNYGNHLDLDKFGKHQTGKFKRLFPIENKNINGILLFAAESKPALHINHDDIDLMQRIFA